MTKSHDPSDSDLITVADLASLIGCSPRSIPNYVADGKLPQPTRIGRLVRWHRQAINAFLAASL